MLIRWIFVTIQSKKLLIDQLGQVFFCQYFIGNLQQLGSGKFFDAAVHFFPAVVFAVVKKAFAHVEGIVLKIVTCHSDLPDDLLLGSMKLGGGQCTVTQLFQLFPHQTDTRVDVPVSV